jgi:hypothetical protein
VPPKGSKAFTFNVGSHKSSQHTTTTSTAILSTLSTTDTPPPPPPPPVSASSSPLPALSALTLAGDGDGNVDGNSNGDGDGDGDGDGEDTAPPPPPASPPLVLSPSPWVPQSLALAYDDKSSTDEVEIGGVTVTVGTAVYIVHYIAPSDHFNSNLLPFEPFWTLLILICKSTNIHAHSYLPRIVK